MLKSLYQRNSDGFGCMIEGDTEPRRILPKRFADILKFYQKHIHHKRGILHLRMRTDGDISLNRVHPYEVIPGRLWMMHNGILSQYRSRDKESDTQKYIAAVLQPTLKKGINVWKSDAFLELVGDDIGSNNRFVLMDNRGNIRFVNRHTGYDLGGDWYANSYSFDAVKFFPEKFKPKPRPNLVPAVQGAALAAASGAYSGWEDHYKPPSVVTGEGWMDKQPAIPGHSNSQGALWRGPLSKNEPAAISKMFPDDVALTVDKTTDVGPSPLTLRECLEKIVPASEPNCATIRSVIFRSLENLRRIDATEYHAILQQCQRVIGSADFDEGARQGLVEVIDITLNEYAL